MGFLGGIVGKFLAAIAEWAGGLFLAFRAGEGKQHTKDVEATNEQARQARKIDDDVARLDDSELDSELRGPGASH